MENTTYVYIISLLVGVICVLIGYSVFVPKNKDSFFIEPDMEDSKGLRALAIITNEMHGALPEGIHKSKSEHRYDKINKLLITSGNPWNLKAEEFAFIRWSTGLIGAIGGVVVWFALYVFNFTMIPWFVIVIFAAIFGWCFPGLHYREKAQERDLDFKRNLPEALDLMVISVSSGRTLNQAIRECLPQIKPSYLRTELAKVSKSIDSGIPMKIALDGFAEKAPSLGIVTFVRSLQESENLSSPVQDILRDRANESRKELFALIRERAAVLPTKMGTVLTLTISASLLIILLAPAVSTLSELLQ